MFRSLFTTTICAVIFTPLMVWGIGFVAAQVMSSDTYQIESDSINVGGGFSSSTNFQVESTVGELATGESGSESFELRAGFQQMQSAQISMTTPAAVLMTPSIPGVAGGFANGSTTVTVTTDSPAGYQILISTESEPALQEEGGSESIADYSPDGDSDYSFTTLDSDAHMGYTILSTHASSRFFNNESVCGTGGINTGENCWDGLSTTTATIVSSNDANHPTGTETKILFRVGVGGSVLQPPGVYTATTTLTAVAL